MSASIQDKNYAVVGEKHSDQSIVEEFIAPLIGEGAFDTLFCEGVDRRYPDPRALDSDYREKYKNLIDIAKSHGAEVYGLGTGEEHYKPEEVAEWADIVSEKAGSSNLMLIGNSHVRFPELQNVDTPNLIPHLEDKGIEDIASTISWGHSTRRLRPEYRPDISPGIYSWREAPKEIPDKLQQTEKVNRPADYLYINSP